MDRFPEVERGEYQHFINIIFSLISYKKDGAVDVERIYRSFNLLSEDDKKLLLIPPADRTFKILNSLVANQKFIELLISGILENDKEYLRKFKDGTPQATSNPKLLDELRYIVRHSIFCKIPSEIDDSEILPTKDPVILQRNVNWVRTMLRQFVRDWSDEGIHERNQCFYPLLDALKRRVPIKDPKCPPRVLCPGSGLGRLPYDVVKSGYSSQGNEFSYFMLIGSNFIINHMIEPKSLKIYPYCLDTSNRMKFEDQLMPVCIPDVCPPENHNDYQDFSMCAGEFTEVYSKTVGEFDAVLTCFFLDTAKNVILYVRTIANVIKEGGLWANIGPLLYHYADYGHNSIELPWDELKSIISKWFTLETVEWKDANYTSNLQSMMKTQYKCVYFEALRNNNPVVGVSLPF